MMSWHSFSFISQSWAMPMKTVIICQQCYSVWHKELQHTHAHSCCLQCTMYIHVCRGCLVGIIFCVKGWVRGSTSEFLTKLLPQVNTTDPAVVRRHKVYHINLCTDSILSHLVIFQHSGNSFGKKSPPLICFDVYFVQVAWGKFPR